MSAWAEGMVERVLGTVGVEVVERRGDEIIALCPGHKEKTGKKDRHPSWSINTVTGVHFCFSCKYKGNLRSLVADLVGGDRVSLLVGGDDTLPVEQPRDAIRVASRTFTLPSRPKERRPIPESLLAVYDPPPDWALVARRLRRRSVQRFGVLWNRDEEAWVLPMRNASSGHLIGFQEKHQKARKMMNRPSGMDKSSTLFGIRNVMYAGRVVVVESPLDAVLLDGLGWPAVAVCGSRLSPRQAEILSGFKEVVLAFDDDDAGRAETERIERWGPGFRFRTARYNGRGKDVGEMTEADIRAALE